MIGETIGGYHLLSEFTTAGGGQSRWAFAERKGTEYFLKEFLKPKYPIDGAPGSPKTKSAQLKACLAFEDHHKGIQHALHPLSSAGGNLVVTTDFFRFGSRYYKVTEKVEVTNWTTGDVMRLPLGARLLLMLTVAHSLNVLHRAGLAHGDIKPPNILIKQLAENRFGTKLIDFDNAVLVDRPLPPPDQIVGDMAYYSPEMVRYINKPSSRARLTGASDIFALGLVYSEWLTGRKPNFDADARYAGVAVARGEALKADGSVPGELGELMEQMVCEPPADRPSAERVHALLRAIRSGMGEMARSAVDGTPPALESGGLRGNLLNKSASRGEIKKEQPSRLRGSLSSKRRA